MNTVSAPAGIGAPVKMRIASPGVDRQLAARAGGQPPADREPGLGIGREIAVPHRIAIDRGIVERRQIDRRDRRRRPARGRARRAAARVSVSVTGCTRSAIIRSMSAIGSSGPENAKQSSVSCAITRLRMAARTASQRHRVLEQQIDDAPRCRSRSITGTRRLRQRRVAGDRDDVRVVRLQQRLAVGGAMDFELGKGVALEAFDQHQIDRRQLGEQVGQVPFRLVAQLVQDGEALGRADDHLGRAGGAVHEGILARLVEVEAVMGVLERGHAAARARSGAG